MRRHQFAQGLLALYAAGLLVACGSVPGPTPTGEPPTPTMMVEPGPAVPEVITVVVPIAGVVEPQGIRLQLSYSGGMLLPLVWGNLPELTLLEDGTLIYQDSQATIVQLAEPEAQALVRQVLDLGFERLESYTDQCQTAADGISQCIFDATTSSIRLRMSDGMLHDVSNYAEFANDLEALRAIRAYLTDFRHPAAQPYIPEKAVLYVRTIGNPGDLPLLAWPLDPALLARAPGEDNYCAQVVGRSEAEALVPLPSQSMGFRYFLEDSQAWEVVLVPWLPGADYTAALAADDRLCPESSGAPAAATPAASSLAGTGWVLVLWEGQSPPPDQPITLRFGGRKYTISVGCNDVSSEYVAHEDGSLDQADVVETTLVECREPLASREKAFVALFRRVSAYRLNGGQLELLDDQGVVLLAFERYP